MTAVVGYFLPQASDWVIGFVAVLLISLAYHGPRAKPPRK